MNPAPNLYLVGYRATGKTSVGRALADVLGRDFVDADALLTAEAGEDVAGIVAREGWEGFRDRESAMLARLSASRGLVVATGGGVVTRPQNVEMLRATGIVVWLTASPAVIAARMGADVKTASLRPSLTGADVLDEIRSVLSAREPLYAGAAHFTVATDGKSVAHIRDLVLKETGESHAG